MTVETEVANLTTAVDNLASAVNVSKATLDTSVSSASSSADDALDSKIAAAVSAAAAELQRSAADAAAAYAATSSALAQTYHISGRNAVNGVMPTFLADFSGQVIDFPNRISSDETVGLRTQTNSAGVIQWAPHNLIKSSEDFASSNWTKTATTVTSNAAMAPDGTLTADLITANSTSQGVDSSTVPVTASILHKFGLFLKYYDNQWVRVNVNGDNVWVDVQNKVLGTDNTEGATLVQLSDGWVHLTADDTTPDTTATLSVVIADADNSTARNNGNSAYIWGAHVYRNDLGGMAKVPTSDRALAALEYYVPNKAVVIGPNLVSNGTFDSSTAGWTAYNYQGHSVTLSSVSGQLNIDNDATNGGNAAAYQSLATTIGAHYKVSFEYVSSSTGSPQCLIRNTVAGSSISSVTTSGAGVYHVYFTATASETLVIFNQNTVTAGATTVYDNITVEEVDRNPSAARHLPRRENHVYDGTAWVKGLLVEPNGATNAALYSDDLSDVTYSKTACSITSDAAVAPDGTTGADEIVEDNTTAQHYINQVISFTSGTQYVFSFYAKANTRDWVRFGAGGGAFSGNHKVWFDVANGTIGTTGAGVDDAFISDAGNGWYRCTVVSTATTTATTQYYLFLATGNNIESYAGDGSSGTYFWGVQCEVGAISTSYIPTSGAAVSRGAESVTIPASVMDSLGLFNTVAVTGTELVTNGGFDTDTDWTKGTGVTIGAGVAALSSVASGAHAIQQNYAYGTGVYEVTFTISNYSAGAVAPNWVGVAGNGPSFSSNGTHTAVMTVRSTDAVTALSMYTIGTTTMDIDNISVKEIHRRGIGIQMHGYMSYGDKGLYDQVIFLRQYLDSSNVIRVALDTFGSDTGEVQFKMFSGGATQHNSPTVGNELTQGVMVPFKIAVRYLDNSLQGALNGIATTANTSAPTLPDLTGSPLDLAYYGAPIHITKFNIFAENTKSSDGTFKMEETFLQRASS